MVVRRGVAGPEVSNGLLPAGTPWEESPDMAACAVVVAGDGGAAPEPPSAFDGAVRLLGMGLVVGALVLAWHLIDKGDPDVEFEEFEEYMPPFDEDFDDEDEDGELT